MEQIIKTFLSVFLMLIMSFVAIGLINTAICVKNADRALDTVSAMWEASNYTLSDAELTAALDNELYVVSTDRARSASNGSTVFASVTLRYRYMIPLLGLSMERENVRSLR